MDIRCHCGIVLLSFRRRRGVRLRRRCGPMVGCSYLWGAWSGAVSSVFVAGVPSLSFGGGEVTVASLAISGSVSLGSHMFLCVDPLRHSCAVVIAVVPFWVLCCFGLLALLLPEPLVLWVSLLVAFLSSCVTGSSLGPPLLTYPVVVFSPTRPHWAELV